MKNTEKTMDKIVALCKNRGFVFPGSEIYGGLANTWDYGPLGAELKKNIKNAWWKKFVQENPYNVGLDAAILMNPQTWVASGHLGGFSDPLMDCRECHERFRADKLIEDWCAETGFELPKAVDAFSQAEMKDFIEEHNIPCPTCGKHNFTDIRQFNLMFKTFQGVTEDAKNTVYLRPETAQGIFVNFNNVQRTTRKKLPFGIGQIGKSFRNEITPGNFIFRVREFEQMELEFFCKPGTDLEWFNYWRTFCHNWLLSIGLKDENLRLRDHDPEELCFYSKATTDFEFLFPFGWGELWGVADRTDYDLTQHQNTSGRRWSTARARARTWWNISPMSSSLLWAWSAACWPSCATPTTRRSSVRTRRATTTSAWSCISIPHWLPSRPRSCLCPRRRSSPAPRWSCTTSCPRSSWWTMTRPAPSASAIAVEDEIGTPFCITLDFETVGDENTPADHCVTIRERDTMEQVRIPIDQVKDFLREKCAF